MLQLVKTESLKTKNILIMVFVFFFFIGLYTFLDFEGQTNYTTFISNFGVGIVSIHIIINVIIALLSSVMVTFSIINYQLHNSEPVGSNAIPFLTFLFGLLTFGCTGCVVAFFSAVGIAFTPIILPAGNLLWKVLALLFTIAGFIWIMYSIQNGKCKVKKAN